MREIKRLLDQIRQGDQRATTPKRTRKRERAPIEVQIVGGAIAVGHRLEVTHQGTRRELLPLALGKKDGEYYLWAYQLGEEANAAYACFAVAEFDDVTSAPGAWPSLDNGPDPGTCIDQIMLRARNRPA